MERLESNGKWYPVNRIDEHLNMAAEFHGVRPNEIRDRLDQGQEVRYRADDWYPYIRNEPKPRKCQALNWVRCDCGHSVPDGERMSASLGTSCPMCYDRMSD